MSFNIRKDQMRNAELFGKHVLFTDWQIKRDEVPKGWFCYDLRGADHNRYKAITLEDKVYENFIGSVLSPEPLKRPATQARRINGQFIQTSELMSLADFCKIHDLEYPQDTRKYELRPASPDEAGLFYSALNTTVDQELACVGHLRLDFGHHGQEFWCSWFSHNGDELNIPEFKSELDEVVNELRESLLKNLASMSGYCHEHSAGRLESSSIGSFGYIAETEYYRYCLRCTPVQGDYNGYLYAYDKRQAALYMAQKQAHLQSTTDPDNPHTYEWFVLENIGASQETCKGYPLLEDAIQRYNEAGCSHKRLGVIKDKYNSVDLIVWMEGDQWFTEDEKHHESFNQDPVVMEAIQKLHQELDAPRAIPGMAMDGP